MGNNKQFNNILDECLEHLLAGNETVEQCLRRYPEYATELEPLLRTAMMMNKAVDVKPSPDFRARARFQLQSIMAESKSPKRAPIFAPRWAMAVCAVLLVFVLSGSMVLAADGSMPGNPLYPVKLVTENFSVRFAGSEERKAELYIAFADRRVTELDYMTANGKLKNMEKVAQRLNTHYAMMNQLSILMGTESTLRASSPAPMLGASGVTDNLTAEQEIAVTGDKSFGDATPPVMVNVLPADSKARLRRVFTYYAITHPDKIQELLDSDKVPESVKPALRRALWAAENGYQNALNNLDK